MLVFAGCDVTHDQIKGTVGLLRYYRRFLASDCARCKSPEDRYGSTMTKEQAERRLWFLVNTAINRKSRVPDPDRSRDTELWRDAQVVQHLVHKNKPSALQWLCYFGGIRQFRTNYFRKRYGYLLHRYDDAC